MNSVGKEKSRIYFGLHCLKKDGTDIIEQDIYRTNISTLITSLNSNDKSIFLDKNETWKNYNDITSKNEINRILFLWKD